MEGGNLITLAYDQIQGLGMLQSLGTTLLSLALAIYMLVELYKLIMSGQADFVTPIIKIGAALIIVNALIPIGGFLSDALDLASKALLKEDVNALAADAWAAAFEGVVDPGITDYVKLLFSPIAWLCLLTYLGLVAIMVIKLLVIDIVCPILLAVVVVSGSLSVPISVFPGSCTMKGWIMNLVEVSIWPLVFHILTTLLFASFANQMKDINTQSMTELRMMYEDMTDMSWRDKMELQLDEKRSKEFNEKTQAIFFKFFKFLAIIAAYGFLCLFTPFLSRMIVRGESAGWMGGVAAAAGAAVIKKTGGFVAKKTGKYGWKFGKWGGGKILQGLIGKKEEGDGEGSSAKSPEQILDERDGAKA